MGVEILRQKMWAFFHFGIWNFVEVLKWWKENTAEERKKVKYTFAIMWKLRKETVVDHWKLNHKEI